MTSESLTIDLIKNFSIDNLQSFFREKLRSFRAEKKDYSDFFDGKTEEKYTNIYKLGEAELKDSDELLVFSAQTQSSLTYKTGKRQQFEMAKKVLQEEKKDAAFFIFYDEEKNFRFSFVKANFEGKSKKYTDFKRYTYFVSKEQSNRTFIEQTEKTEFSDIDSIIEAFSIEPLNKQFYKDISNAFNQLTDETTPFKLPYVTDKEVIKKFAVRLIGRIIFVWFLKNKISKNGTSLVPKDWLSSKKVTETENYYHFFLEKLFFQVLNKPLDERFETILEDHQKIPFLNGGLFEAQEEDYYKADKNGLSTSINTLQLPNSWIKDFFETLERYNFTIDENSLSDQEVSIDPEMLGTIFENLLGEIETENTTNTKSKRKATGSFYTPRSIVDYMVEESLVTYLKQNTNQKEEKLRELFRENDIQSTDFEDREQIIDAFLNVKVLDPACGSGAFPISILQKINFALQKIDPKAAIFKDKLVEKIDDAWVRNHVSKELNQSTTDYIRKFNIIEKCIFGIDIEPIANEISKLRCFLTLIVDEKVDDNLPNRGIRPLPNLEFKFVIANSLVDRIQDKQKILDYGNADLEVNKLKKLREDYLQASGNKKKEIKDKFLELQNKIAVGEIKKGTKGHESEAMRITEWKPFANEKVSWIDPKFMFGIENGFDIIIGNPPYIKEYSNKKAFDGIRKTEHYQGKMDLWYAFVTKGLGMLKEKTGILCFIATNNWVTNSGASIIRNKVTQEAKIEELIDFGSLMVFENASIQTMIMRFKNDISTDNYSFDYKKYSAEPKNSIDKENEIKIILGTEKDPKVQVLQPTVNRKKIKDKLITFGSDEVEILLEKIKKQQNFILNKNTEVAQGIVFPQDELNKKNQKVLGNDYKVGQGIFVISEKEKKAIQPTEKEKELLKPYYTTKQLKQFYGDRKNKEWIIYTDSKFNNASAIAPYPNIKKHLDQFQEIITSDNKPYGLHRARKENFFVGEKIIALRKCANYPVFTYTDFDAYVSATFYVIKTKRINQKYLTALLNSSLIRFWLKNKGKMQGKNYQIDKEPLLEIPIKEIENTEVFERIVDYILFINEYEKDEMKNNLRLSYFKSMLDALVFEIYFEEEVRKSNKILLAYFKENPLPCINCLESFNEKYNTVELTYEKLYDIKNPIRVTTYYLDTISEYKTIQNNLQAR